jgi:pyrimidine deaminase RibD-like protein
MRRVVALRAVDLGATSPNPSVTCVLPGQDGNIVGKRYSAASVDEPS